MLFQAIKQSVKLAQYAQVNKSLFIKISLKC